MARVTLGEGEPFEVPDNDEVLLAYYQGEGAIVERGIHVVARGPMEFDGKTYVDPPVLTIEDGELVSSGTGEQMTAVEHPADGTMSPEISNESDDSPPRKR